MVGVGLRHSNNFMRTLGLTKYNENMTRFTLHFYCIISKTAYPRLYTYIANKCELGDSVMTATRAPMLKLEKYKCKGLKSNRVFLGDTCDPFILSMVRFQVRCLV